MQIKCLLKRELRQELIKFLMINIGISAWSVSICGVGTSAIVHHLNINPTCRLVKQKKLSIRVEKQQAL